MPPHLLTSLMLIIAGGAVVFADANRLTYLDEFCDPYYVHRNFPKLTTPQWVGDEGVEAVIVLAIDDMRGHEKWEEYLRPIIDRLKKIDGRAPISIMTCNVDPAEPHLQTWLKEGLSIEVHTIDHPCPCLQGGDFAKAAKTYHDCVDLMASIPGNRPVAFRMPCCDSRNTPSPRFWREIFNGTSPKGNYLQIDSSVFNITTPADESLPRELVVDDEGKPRFRRYLPFPSFVNTIDDYPYPYVIGGLCWEFPCVVPSDWEAQNIQRPNNPLTVEDMQRVLDATVLKQGVYNLVFHPHGWIRSEQIIEIIDYAEKKHGRKVKFLNFAECAARLNKNLLAGQPLRGADGGADNGVRILDLNADGFQDVVIGNERKLASRVWIPAERRWRELDFPVKVATPAAEARRDGGVRFGVLQENGFASCLVDDEHRAGLWHFVGDGWHAVRGGLDGLRVDGERVMTARAGVDQGVRLRDLDGDGAAELIVANPRQQAAFQWDADAKSWKPMTAKWPSEALVVNEHGIDAGLRFVDLSGDGHIDLVSANEKSWQAWRFDSLEKGWPNSASGKQGDEQSIPPIVRGETNNGAWFHSGHLWVQNEDTAGLPDGVARLKLSELAAWIDEAQTGGKENAGLPGPKPPEESLAMIKVRSGLKVELVAAEPHIVDPIAFDWGLDGRLWVAEMRDYPLGMDGKGKPGGRVKVLTDVDDDGDYEKAEVFLDDLPYPTGVKVWRSGVLVTAAPKIIYAEDTDGDNRADKIETLYEGFGEGNQQHRVNGLRLGLDNWLYVGHGDSGGNVRSLKTGEEVDVRQRDLRIRPDEGLIEAISGNTQYGINRDDWGNWFGGNNSTPAWHYVLDDALLRRNPHFAPPPVKREISVTPGAARVFPLSKTFERFNDHARANHFTSACSPEIYRDHVLGEEFYGNIFVCEPVHNLIHREVVTPAGVSFTSRRADDEAESEFLASSDNWFRPTMIRTGPDGALWVADMYRLVIEHPQWIPQEWQARLNLRAGDDRGRIYRIVPEKGEPVRVPRLQALDARALALSLESPNGVVRDLAQQALVWGNEEPTRDWVLTVLGASKSPVARLHALGALDGMGALTPSIVGGALTDDHAGVRRLAVRLAAQFENDDDLSKRVAQLIDDGDPQVRLQLAYTAGTWRDHRQSGRIIAAILARDGHDAFLRAAAMSSLHRENIGHVVAAALEEKTAADHIELLLAQAAAFGAGDAILPALAQITRPDGQRQFSTRKMEIAAQVLAKLAANESLSDTLGTAQRQLTPLLHAARDRIARDDAEPQSVVAALALLRAAGDQQQADLATLKKRIRSSQPPDVQSAALASWLALSSDEALRELFAGWRGYTPELRNEIIHGALASDEGAAALLQHLADGAIAARQFDAASRRALLEHRSESVRAQAAKLFSGGTVSTRRQVVEDYRAAITLAGDAKRGRELFAKHCHACHRQEDAGRAVGPDLATLSNRSPEALVVAVLDPNSAVEDKFLSYTAALRDGRVVSGMLVGQSGGALTLQTADGKTLELLRKDLDELASSEKSFMPEGLEQDLSPEALADVVAYVRSIGAPPKQFAGNEPAVVVGDSEGLLHLPASQARIYGSTVIFEPQYKNLGYWSSEDDRAVWMLKVDRPARYRVAFDYACLNDAAGESLVLEVGTQRLGVEVAGTGTWDDYRWQDIGELELAAGQHELVVRSDGPIRRALIDLRHVRLTPIR